MLKSLIFLSAIIASGLCRNTASSYNALYSEQISDKVNNKNDESLINWMDISSVYQKYKNYTSNDISVFLKLKLLSSINALANSDIDLGNGIRFAKDETTRIDNDDDDTNEYNENAILRSLPRSLNEKEDILSSKIWKRISKVLRSHTMQIKFPSAEEYQRSMNDARGQGDKKNRGALIMIPLLLGGTFIPIAYGALALLAGKALIVSKLALVLASIIGIKKLVSHSGGHHESSHEVVVSGHGGSGWGRDFDLAYNAHTPKTRA